MSDNTLRIQIALEGPNYITKELLLDVIRPEWSLKVAFFGNYWTNTSPRLWMYSLAYQSPPHLVLCSEKHKLRINSELVIFTT